MKAIVCAAAAVFFIVPASAQVSPMQVQRTQPAAANVASLPANTEVYLRLNEELTTKGDWMEEGHTFALTVTNNVMLGDYIIIPEGSRATGVVTWMTNKGMFGKSGKFEIDVTSVEVNGRRIPLEGTFRQEGEGNTVATVGAVVAAPVIGFFITGRSGRMPAGTELTVFTKEDIEVQFDGPPPVQNAPMTVSRAPASSVTVAPDEPFVEEAPHEVVEESQSEPEMISEPQVQDVEAEVAPDGLTAE